MVSEKNNKTNEENLFTNNMSFCKALKNKHSSSTRSRVNEGRNSLSETEEDLYYANGPWIHLWAFSQRRNREEWVETF